MELTRPMGSSIEPTYPEAVWTGEIDRAALLQVTDETIKLDQADGYHHARLLVRDGGAAAGFADVTVINGYVSTVALQGAVALVDEVAPLPTLTTFPKVTVAIVTHNRAHMLKDALDSVLSLDYPNYDILVIDNAPSNAATRNLVTKYPRVTYAVEPVKGSGFGRNRALKLATGDIIACIDDDVVADRHWLTALVGAFQLDSNIACVTGLIPSGELATEAQLYFDNRVTWNRILKAVTYNLKNRPAGVPLFPFQVGLYGTGANFALRRSALRRVGLFDTAFGAGHITGGAEDIDMFTRVILAGYSLQVCPNAVAWHRHRADLTALKSQTTTYGTGLGAWLTKLALTPRLWPRLARSVLGGMRQTTRLGAMDNSAAPATTVIGADMEASLRRVEKVSILRGPGLYFKQRLHNLRYMLSPAGWAQSLLRNATLSVAGLLAALQALVVFMPELPVVVRGLLLAAFVFYVPGMAFFHGTRFDRLMKAVLVPLIGLSLLIIMTTGLAVFATWAPTTSLLWAAGSSLLIIFFQQLRTRRREILWQ